MEQNKKHQWFISGMAGIAALGIGYYFFYSLPKYNQAKLNFEKEKQANEDKVEKEKLDASKQKSQAETAKNIKDDCIKTAKNVYFDFDESIINGNPIFYPYEDENSFNKNERIVLGISSFQSCFFKTPEMIKAKQ